MFLVKDRSGKTIHETNDLMEARKIIEQSGTYYVQYDEKEVEKYNDKIHGED